MTDYDKKAEGTDETVTREAWERPEVRQLDASDAETSVSGINVDGGFS